MDRGSRSCPTLQIAWERGEGFWIGIWGGMPKNRLLLGIRNEFVTISWVDGVISMSMIP